MKRMCVLLAWQSAIAIVLPSFTTQIEAQPEADRLRRSTLHPGRWSSGGSDDAGTAG